VTRCPHASPPLVSCARCVQRLLEAPPVKKPRPTGATRKRRPLAWVAKLPGRSPLVYEGVSLSVARRALRHVLGHRGPPGTVWEPRYSSAGVL